MISSPARPLMAHCIVHAYCIVSMKQVPFLYIFALVHGVQVTVEVTQGPQTRRSGSGSSQPAGSNFMISKST